MHPVVEEAVQYLMGNYSPRAILLYGSFAAGTPTDESDIDVLVFTDHPSNLHDSRVIDGHYLDAWIYPVEKSKDAEAFVHAFPFRVLHDSLGLASDLGAAIEAIRKQKTLILEPAEKQRLEGWITKMLARASQDTAEANYRYRWVLQDLPELYCQFRGRYFDGPVKTLRRMRESDPILFQKYETLLSATKNVALARDLYTEVLNPKIS